MLNKQFGVVCDNNGCWAAERGLHYTLFFFPLVFVCINLADVNSVPSKWSDRTRKTSGETSMKLNHHLPPTAILLLSSGIEAPLSKSVKQPLLQSSGPGINGVGTNRVAVWACPLPSMASLPQGCSSRQANSVSLCWKWQKHTGDF